MRNHKLTFRLRKGTREILAKKWKERDKPSIDDIHVYDEFCSESEYIEFIVMATNRLSEGEWRIFCHWANPYKYQQS